ncbi:MAG TPA: isopentenyl-diphosphate delta-isomerase [Acidimicrobiaceae bacterium]|nr:isopentenyl-diphosphate delta-isomerase [Acidimicrobiaceae bacterium]HCB37698.1 isopentenyl-diphosphate delta-isomerase [Acidimicrobiaceae bacterium]
MSADPELLDVLDAAGAVIGIAPRAAVHERGLWHRVFHCQIVAVRNGVPTMVLQRRHPSKLAFGGLLDVSAAGHLTAAEEPVDGVRELAEELGVVVEPAALVPLGVRRMVNDDGEGDLNKELTHVFLLRDDRPLAEYRPAPGEVEAVFEVPVDELLDLFGGQVATVELRGPELRGRPAGEPPTAAPADFVPDPGYWITLAVMCGRFGRGELPVAI